MLKEMNGGKMDADGAEKKTKPRDCCLRIYHHPPF